MLVSQQETVLEVVDARNTIKRNLAPPDGSGGATASYGKLYTRPDLSDVVAMAGRLPPPPAGQAYHLWLTQAGQSSAPQLAGVLAFNQGFGLLVFDAAQPGPTYNAAWVTLQPPGSAAPAGPTVLRWQGS